MPAGTRLPPTRDTRGRPARRRWSAAPSRRSSGRAPRRRARAAARRRPSAAVPRPSQSTTSPPGRRRRARPMVPTARKREIVAGEPRVASRRRRRLHGTGTPVHRCSLLLRAAGSEDHVELLMSPAYELRLPNGCQPAATRCHGFDSERAESAPRDTRHCERPLWQRQGPAWHRFGSDARQGAVVRAVRTKGK